MTMGRTDSYEQSLSQIKALKKRQRRFQWELLIAVAVICLMLGFMLGAGWHYAKTREVINKYEAAARHGANR